MKTNSITLSLYSASYNAKAMEQLCGHYKTEFETKQVATYTVENGLATITALTPVFCTPVALPLPFIVPVHDLGSGILKSIEINVDTLAAHESICPTQVWVERRMQQPVITTQQALWADYNSLV